MKNIRLQCLLTSAALFAVLNTLLITAAQAQDSDMTSETATEAEEPLASTKSENKHAEKAERLAKLKASRQEQAQQHLQKALATLATINEKRQSGDQTDTSDALTNDYFAALLNLAKAYDSTGEKDRALESFKEAAEVLKAQSARLTVANKKSFIRSRFAHYPDDAEGDKNLLAYIDACMTPDLCKDDTEGDAASAAARAAWRLPFDTAVLAANAPRRLNDADKSRLKSYWQQLLALYELKSGKTSPTLASFYKSYANFCITTKDLAEAEKALQKVCDLDYKSNSSSAATHYLEELHLAQFYLHHKMFDKATTTWQAVEKQIDMPLDDGLAASFCRLAKNYQRAGFEDQMLAIYTKLLNCGGDAVLKNIDEPLEQLVQADLSSFAYAQADTLIKLRLAASAKSHQDTGAIFWKVKQSDLYLATGRTVESKTIFDQVLANQALQGISTDSLRDDRAKLLLQLGKASEASSLRKTIAVHQKNPVTIRFGLQAKQNIILGNNTKIQAYDSSLPDAMPFRPAPPGTARPKATIACGGKIEIQGNFSFNGTICGAISDLGRKPILGPNGATLSAAPTDLAQTPDAIAAPDGTPYLSAAAPDLAVGGDYILDASGENSLRQLMLFMHRQPKSTLRLFISDKLARSQTIELTSMPSFGRQGVRAEDLQFWYNGIRPIKINSASALVYAPNATVIIPFNGTFSGAIVAARIVLEGNNQIAIDSSLIGKTFQP